MVQHALNISLLEGEMVCMLGPNGCGKSTLLRTLAGLQPALDGDVLFRHGDNLSPLGEKEGALKLSLVLTERLSMENTTVHDVVAMGRYPYTSFLGGLSPEDEQAIDNALAAVGYSYSPQGGSPMGVTAQRSYSASGSPMGVIAQRSFNSLSDGEKQRVLIAKSLAQETPIILLDEPTAHLDLPNRIRTLQLLRQLAHEQGKTVLISTHELDLALALSDRILLMSENGVDLDSAENLKASGAFTRAFNMDIFHPLC